MRTQNRFDGVDWDLDLHEPSPDLRADPGQLQQVLLNLLVNARQAMPQGGRLVIRVAPAPTGGMVDLTVRDTGCGMTQEVMRRMLDRKSTRLNSSHRT